MQVMLIRKVRNFKIYCNVVNGCRYRNPSAREYCLITSELSLILKLESEISVIKMAVVFAWPCSVVIFIIYPFCRVLLHIHLIPFLNDYLPVAN